MPQQERTSPPRIAGILLLVATLVSCIAITAQILKMTRAIQSYAAPGVVHPTVATVSPRGQYVVYVGKHPNSTTAQLLSNEEHERLAESAISVTTSASTRNSAEHYDVIDATTLETTVTHAWVDDDGNCIFVHANGSVSHWRIGSTQVTYSPVALPPHIQEFTVHHSQGVFWLVCRTPKEVSVRAFHTRKLGYTVSDTTGLTPLTLDVSANGVVTITYPTYTLVGTLGQHDLKDIVMLPKEQDRAQWTVASADGKRLVTVAVDIGGAYLETLTRTKSGWHTPPNVPQLEYTEPKQVTVDPDARWALLTFEPGIVEVWATHPGAKQPQVSFSGVHDLITSRLTIDDNGVPTVILATKHGVTWQELPSSL